MNEKMRKKKGMEDSKVEREPHTSCMDEMTYATPLSQVMQCVNQDDKNLTNKQENCALTCQCSCALC